MPRPKSDFRCRFSVRRDFRSRHKIAGETRPHLLHLTSQLRHPEPKSKLKMTQVLPVLIVSNDLGNYESCCYRQSNSQNVRDLTSSPATLLRFKIYRSRNQV